jgi:hypothetical protein
VEAALASLAAAGATAPRSSDGAGRVTDPWGVGLRLRSARR